MGCTLRRSVNGGITTTSTASVSFSRRSKASLCTRAIASRWCRFIFQLPATSGRRPGRPCDVMPRATSGLQGFDAGQRLALEVLQRCPATGADVAEPTLVDAELAHSRGAVPAADDGQRVRQPGDRLG